jgi:outer membrane receptor for ferrienterochelin and colicin
MIQQFIYFPTPDGIALGGVASTASRYGVYNGGTWTESSFDEFISQGGTIDPSTGAVLTDPGNVTLETLDVPYLKPEELTSFEIGFNSIISKTLLIDLNYYHTTYTNFLGGVNGYSKEATTHRGEQIDAGTRWLLYANSPSKIKSDGVSLGATYNLPNNFVLTGNYTYTTFSGEQPEGFLTMFNTPKNRYNLGFSNNKLTEYLGFNVNFSYQDAFIWESDYGTATMPSYSLIDAQVNYKFSAFKTIVKIGATNIGGSDYRTNFGSAFIGQTYYVSIVFDELLRN